MMLASLCAAAPSAAAPTTVAELVGTWAGTLVHGKDSTAIAMTFAADTADQVILRLSLPVIHLDHSTLGIARLVASGDSVRLGPFAFRHDRQRGTLSGIVPAEFVPVHQMPVTLQRVPRFEAPPRPPLDAPERAPAWRYEAGSAVWAGPTFDGGVVYAGTAAGEFHAIDAATGARRWMQPVGGPIRTRPVVDRGAIFAQADDGYLYRLSTADGRIEWKTQVVDGAIARLPFSDPRSRFDRFGSDVTVAGGRLYVGTHDGRVLAIDPADGRIAWSFKAGDAVLAAPAVADGRVLVGSYDKHVYALDAATGALLWKRDTRGAVVSTPAIDGPLAIVGNRAYDLYAFEAATGNVVWQRYIWMSWVESSATLAGGVAYLGSSDAAAAFAFASRDGKPAWKTDVRGWAWGQPVVTADRVYIGTSSQVGYLAHHRGGIVALDRRSGAPVWQYVAESADTGAFGIPGSLAHGAGRVFAGTLDGRVLAFER
jgi:outer membrane protein assembly factor BamB